MVKTVTVDVRLMDLPQIQRFNASVNALLQALGDCDYMPEPVAAAVERLWRDVEAISSSGTMAASTRVRTMALIWRNELHPHELPGPFATEPPRGTIEITRVEEAGGHYHIWYAPVPAVPATTTDEDRIRDAMAGAQDHPGRTITR